MFIQVLVSVMVLAVVWRVGVGGIVGAETASIRLMLLVALAVVVGIRGVRTA